jgi:enamine deaminase RidA (YjgF/YER057c/UK114 family)
MTLRSARRIELLTALPILLPAPPKPVGNYVEWVRVGNLLYLAGHGGAQARGKGKVGRDLTPEQGYQEAREVGLNLLATTRDAWNAR